MTSLNHTLLFSLILQLYGIIILQKLNEKKILQDLATDVNLRKRSINLRKLRKGLSSVNFFVRKGVAGIPQAVLEEWWVKMMNGEPLPGRWKKTLGCQGTCLCLYWMSYG